MDETEKMTALKKAYAEIILNTAKEAAARIMVSERKAHQFYHDLSSMKEEALRLLLRQKQTMDAKINEVEMKSLNQQRRIKELEAQLHEAEDIVSNLRAELNEANSRLEEMENDRTNNTPNLIKMAHFEEGIREPEIGLAEAVSVAQTNSLIKPANGNYVANNFVQEFGCSGDPVVPSIIIRSKNPELYRNGCTQRIRAYEGNLMNGHFSFSESEDLKNEKVIRGDREGEVIYMTPIGADATFSIGKKSFDIEEVRNIDKSSSKPQVLKSFRKRRKRAARYGRSNPSVLKSIPLLAKETHSDHPNSQTCLPDSHDLRETSDTKRNGTHLHPPSRAPSNASELGISTEHVATVQGYETEVHMAVVNEDMDVVNSLMLKKQKNDSGDYLNDPSSKQDPEMKKTSINPDSKLLEADDGFSSPPRKDRVLKYTFQRKRKKESLSGDDSSLHQENPLKRKLAKKPNDNLEAPRAAAESLRDSRRMAQVARQLISLSDKKYWK